MSFNITAKDAKFIVNKDKGIVVCVIENTADMFKDFVSENFIISSSCDFEWTFKNTHNIRSRLCNQLTMPNRFTGIARCSADDEWNEEIGRTIAFSRAKDKVLKSFYKRANTYVHYIDNGLGRAIETLNAMGEKLTINSEKRQNHINSLLGVEEK